MPYKILGDWRVSRINHYGYVRFQLSLIYFFSQLLVGHLHTQPAVERTTIQIITAFLFTKHTLAKGCNQIFAIYKMSPSKYVLA